MDAPGMNFSIFFATIFYLAIHGLPLVSALYEDQAGSFDWRQQYVGRSLFTEYIHTSHRIIVGTEQNVIAAINSKNGQIGWRQVLEKGAAGRIDALQVSSGYVLAVLSGGEHVRCLNVISGSLHWESFIPLADPAHRARLLLFANPSGLVSVLSHDRVKTFNIESGNEEWMTVFTDSERVKYSHTTRINHVLYIVGVTPGSHVKIARLDDSGKELSSRLIPAGWIVADNKCTMDADGHFVCVDKNTGVLQLLDLVNGTTFTSFIVQDTKVNYKQASFVYLPHSPDDSIVALRCNSRDFVVLSVDNATLKVTRYLPEVSAVQLLSSGDKITMITASRSKDTDVVNVNGYDLTTRTVITDMARTIHYPLHHGSPLELYGVLTKLKDSSTGFHLVTIAEDHSLSMLQHSGKVLWTREEALASILSVEMVDLPVSQIMAKMEDEFGSRDDVIHLLMKRLRTQLSQLMTFFLQLKHKLKFGRYQSIGSSSSGRSVGGVSQNDFTEDSENTDNDDGTVDEDYLTRDDFSLHKMIVAVTAAGKIFGLDSNNGRSVWRKFLPNIESFRKDGREEILPLFIQRTTAHFPHQPLSTIFGRDKVTGWPVLYSFHPITGVSMDGMAAGGELLNYRVINVVMLTQMDDQFMHPLVLLDDQYQYHVFPESATAVLKEVSTSLFTFISDPDTGLITGYNVKDDGKQLTALPLWTVDLNKNSQKITQVISKPAIEHVHSQGIVLEDRSVLYKYINPNLVAVVTEGDDPVQKAFFSIYLIDTVTGNLVFHCTHKKSKGPIHLIHSENWVSYNYWNQKLRRNELAVLELYEGTQQSNATAFSSFHPPAPPIVMRQAYIFPGFISAMSTTVTEKGITSKELIFALESGSILSLPKIFVDPRRPEIPSSEPREEGSQIMVPYMPELPRPSQNIINYYQTVLNIRGIHTAPAGLESTCLLLCYGLDLFYTRVMPSKMFDVLKEDFDYIFISSVLFGMIAVSVISQKLATRKALNKAWK